eukprot:TRINITY_DN5126_c0_g1_i1.p2 TRINITY_DN5126_c0_g1~~TRINITY_DN5126_c0_g1_i1.p2  ORF type:complete len:118 (+),score=11.58 TRINITY_DN5126_c0_g1_i1:29-355(+)
MSDDSESSITSIDYKLSLNEDVNSELFIRIRDLKKELDSLEGRLAGDYIIRKPKKSPFLTPRITNNILLFSFIWQLLNVGIMELVFYFERNNNSDIAYTLIVISVFQV